MQPMTQINRAAILVRRPVAGAPCEAPARSTQRPAQMDATILNPTKSGDLALKWLLPQRPSNRAPEVPHAAVEAGLAALLAQDLPREEHAGMIGRPWL